MFPRQEDTVFLLYSGPPPIRCHQEGLAFEALRVHVSWPGMHTSAFSSVFALWGSDVGLQVYGEILRQERGYRAQFTLHIRADPRSPLIWPLIRKPSFFLFNNISVLSSSISENNKLRPIRPKFFFKAFFLRAALRFFRRSYSLNPNNTVQEQKFKQGLGMKMRYYVYYNVNVPSN
ncbi:Hypothetical predicted protein [Xyrichtys novacula]|uniref:Uncharacterized protein n=1 Tax=Xyrichtys novacula TaxID=13765 RepID=A0AAV1H9X5_XYRNO|nr:Hypothetical predicted protein [Xyrichtys novacula]